jgi:hypothetical protein
VNTQPSEYEKQATELLAKFGVQFIAELIGNDCPQYCKDAQDNRDMDKLDKYPRKTHIHGKHYRCFLTRAAKTVSFDFWNSYANEEENFFAFGNHDSLNNWVTGRENMYWDKYRIGKKYPSGPRIKKRIIPVAYDLLACLQKSDVGTFQDFCGDFGYDTDSKRAESTYRAVCEEYRKVSSFFTPEELQALQEVQ